ncbi:probable LRR receptor-like serine/threonine-protein kinase RKF3 [Juglans microcarpa x Juglans regia]|uniref:probable LRR receptor-like serine/threonine-protein kinase RKF3 n=1 Tax=Juglans microcarpa x Juglans regia TaxID=2249226 RepID=UPI001B7EC2F3|nr:probable LRR receptor-like serine/threonine-protein kinase RKF3 [Juglans microcarpa x Juglans regia]
MTRQDDEEDGFQGYPSQMAQQHDHHEAAAAIGVDFEGPDSVNGHLGIMEYKTLPECKEGNQTSKSPPMATSYFFLFIFILLCSPCKINSSSCSLNFSQFPYEAHSECFDIDSGSIPSSVLRSCCSSALQSFFQAMAIKTNQSGSIFLQMDEAQDCFNTFQSLHQRTNLNKCEIQQFISSSTPNLCSKGVYSITNFLGFERYSAVQSNCKDLSASYYSDETCFNCVSSYSQSLQALKEGDSSNGQRCAEALLVSLASSDVNTPNWVYGTFSCLWSEIQLPWTTQNQKKGPLLSSKELIATVIAVAVLVILAPILYTLTRKQLQHASEEDMDNLSVVALKKELEDEARSHFDCSGLYVFSQDEMNRATNSFDNSNLIGEGTLGKMYIGRMPSGMRVAIKRLKEGIKLHTLVDDICQKAKIRHPNLVSTLGYCDRGDECLVSEFCVNGDLESWLLGKLLCFLLYRKFC